MPIVDRRFVLTMGPPWGFRVYLDNTGVLTISKVRGHSPAELAKLRSGDQIISLNSKNVANLNLTDAITLIDTTFGTLDIQISRFESTSTKILIFDKADVQIPDDIRTNINLNLIRSERTPEETRVPECTPEPESYSTKESVVLGNLVNPLPSDVHSVLISKLIKGYDSTDNSNDKVQKKEKQFSDSSFYNDPCNLYPTTGEKMEIARKVAASLYDPDNQSSKGAMIFEKQRKRAEKYTLQNEESKANVIGCGETIYDLDHWPDIAQHKEKSPSPLYRLGYSPLSSMPVPPPPPPPASAPNKAKTIDEFMEKIQKFPKANHNVVSPDICFDIAAALHSSDSRGAQIFAKQKHRAQKWTLTAPESISVEPILATSLGESHNYRLTTVTNQQSEQKIVTISSRKSLLFETEARNETLNIATTTRKPTHVIRRGSNQGPMESVTIDNTLSISTSSNMVAGPLQTDTVLAATNTKWKPVKFNVPQRV